jgi:hypothetical protein
MEWSDCGITDHLPRRVVTGETGLAHTGSIVYDQGGNIIVTHFEFLS